MTIEANHPDQSTQTSFKRRLLVFLASNCMGALSVCFTIFFVSYFHIKIAENSSSIREVLEIVSKKVVKRSSDPPHALLQRSEPGLEVIQLVGALQAVHVSESGVIGPWQLENEVAWANLTNDKTVLTINSNGVYFIYAQIHYFTDGPTNSFEIVKWVRRPKFFREARDRSVLSICTAQAAAAATTTDVSCYTGIVAYLQDSDQVSLHQIERDRLIYFSKGYSQWGIIKLEKVNET